ncbi:MAG: hypothetical protein ACAH83_10315 [Alphaproteobacteria bacterium]
MKYLKNKKILIIAAVAAMVLPGGVLYATTTNVGATATFLSAITLTPTNMQFGKITFGATPGGSDTVALTTASAISYNGTFASGGSSTVAAGDVAITGTAGNVLNVSCATSGVLAQASGAGRITVNTIKIANESAAAGGGNACAGTGTTVLSFTLTATTDDQLKLGGVIDGSTQVSFGSGAYSTSNSGGSSVQVDVVYQ